MAAAAPLEVTAGVRAAEEPGRGFDLKGGMLVVWVEELRPARPSARPPLSMLVQLASHLKLFARWDSPLMVSCRPLGVTVLRKLELVAVFLVAKFFSVRLCARPPPSLGVGQQPPRRLIACCDSPLVICGPLGAVVLRNLELVVVLVVVEVVVRFCPVQLSARSPLSLTPVEQ